MTLARFDVAYHNIFRVNKKRLRDYDNLWAYARDLYQTPGFGDTTDFAAIKKHYHIRNQRRDYLHKLSRKIADNYDAVAVEDIDMKAMGQHLHFGKSVQDNGYGMFREMLDYKLAWKGKKMVKVDRFFPSSKKCCKCGRIKKELKLSERVYRCACGNEMDRDRNAAINIREEARRMLTA